MKLQKVLIKAQISLFLVHQNYLTGLFLEVDDADTESCLISCCISVKLNHRTSVSSPIYSRSYFHQAGTIKMQNAGCVAPTLAGAAAANHSLLL